MALPSSGQISLSDVNVELGLSSTQTISLNDSIVRTLFGVSSGAISMSDGYGKSNVTEFEITISDDVETVGGLNLNSFATNQGWNGQSKLIVTINPGVKVSTTMGFDAILIDGFFPNGLDIINYGSILGRGGDGGSDFIYFNINGGNAITYLAVIYGGNSSIINHGVIAGGGGGGGLGVSEVNAQGYATGICFDVGDGYVFAGGGGGAGGGHPGYSTFANGGNGGFDVPGVGGAARTSPGTGNDGTAGGSGGFAEADFGLDQGFEFSDFNDNGACVPIDTTVAIGGGGGGWGQDGGNGLFATMNRYQTNPSTEYATYWKPPAPNKPTVGFKGGSVLGDTPGSDPDAFGWDYGFGAVGGRAGDAISASQNWGINIINVGSGVIYGNVS